jgi:hypothetical protein
MKQFNELKEAILEEISSEFSKQIDQEILKTILWEKALRDHPDWHMVRLKWEKGKDTDYYWTEACAWAMEQFGLPGDRYVTSPTTDYMDFLFEHKEDAVLMTLKWI